MIPLVDPLAKLVEPPLTPPAEAPPSAQEESRPTELAAPTSRSASVEEMLAIAAELGLGSHAEDLRRLAVSSARLTPTTNGGGSSFAGGEPALPGSIEVPDLGGPAQFIAVLDLAGRGRLWIFRSDSGADETTSPEAAAVFEQAGPGAIPTEAPPGAISLSVSRELTLPRPWSRTAAPLHLSPAEQGSWQDLRTRLAAEQGVPLGESAPPHVPIHRIDGYPDERRGDMPLICELRLLGVDLGDRPPAAHPLAGALENETDSWRMLAQLATDDSLGWSWGPRFRRLYVWGHSEDPMSDDYDSVQVVVQ